MWFREQNYEQTCLLDQSCQSQIFNVDDKSSVSVYTLNTVGTTESLSVNGKPVISSKINLNGFAQVSPVRLLNLLVLF